MSNLLKSIFTICFILFINNGCLSSGASTSNSNLNTSYIKELRNLEDKKINEIYYLLVSDSLKIYFPYSIKDIPIKAVKLFDGHQAVTSSLTPPFVRLIEDHILKISADNISVNKFDFVEITDESENTFKLHVGQYLMETTYYSKIPDDQLLILRHGKLEQMGNVIKLSRGFSNSNGDSSVELKVPHTIEPYISSIENKKSEEGDITIYEYIITLSEQLFTEKGFDTVSLNIDIVQRYKTTDGHLITSFIPISSEEFFSGN